jgi:large subunit ribosomal protein L1
LYHHSIMKHGKKYREVALKIEKDKVYEVKEAVAFFQENKLAKFNESLEVHIRLGINPRKTDEMVRITTTLPHGTGRTEKVAVVTTTKEKEAKAAGADLVGGEELIEAIKNGKTVPGTDFTVLLATPEVMPKLAVVAKVLGPKGLMPSPKNETVTPKVEEVIDTLKKGKKVSFKNDDSANLHQSLGKLSFTAEQLVENFAAFKEIVDRSKPEALKGRLVKGAYLTTTMGPSLPIEW